MRRIVEYKKPIMIRCQIVCQTDCLALCDMRTTVNKTERILDKNNKKCKNI